MYDSIRHHATTTQPQSREEGVWYYSHCTCTCTLYSIFSTGVQYCSTSYQQPTEDTTLHLAKTQIGPGLAHQIQVVGIRHVPSKCESTLCLVRNSLVENSVMLQTSHKKKETTT